MKLRWRSLLLPRNVFSPVGLLSRAAVLALLYLVAHLLGFRESTSILSGTLPSGGAAILGVAYILLYFASVLVVPVLVLGSAILWVLLRISGDREEASPKG